MRIGILETGNLDANIQQEFGSYAEMFQRLLLSVDTQIQFTVYDVTKSQYPTNIETCDAYLITGSKYSVYDNKPWIKELQGYIVNLHNQCKKLIGICFGHQIIAHTLGGLAEKSNNGWGVGNVVSHIEKEMDWNKNATKTYSLLMSHQDQVIKLPDNAILIARNKHSSNDSFQIENHILTFQGHPEFTEVYLKYSMDKRRTLIGEEKYKNAMNSLMTPHDGRVVAQWIIDFINIK